MKPFLAGCAGGAVGALYASITGITANAYGITGLFGFLITTSHTVNYLILMLISGGIAFVLTFLFYRDQES